MKYVVFLSLALTVFGDPVVKTWTLNELSEAITSSKTDSTIKPHLEDALNQIMLALFTGFKVKSIYALVPSPEGSATWTMNELKEALKDQNTKPELRPAIMQAVEHLDYNNHNGKPMNSIEVSTPALDISIWTLPDLEKAINSSDTNPELVDLLKQALSKWTEKNPSEKNNKIIVVTPVGLVKTQKTEKSSLFKKKP